MPLTKIIGCCEAVEETEALDEGGKVEVGVLHHGDWGWRG